MQHVSRGCCWLAVRRRVWDCGLACAFCASLIFSLSALQVKLTGGRVPVVELCLIRSSLSFGTSLMVGTASRIQPLFGHRSRLPLLFLRGLFGTAAISCSYVAVLNLPLGDSVTLAQLRPPMMAVMGHLLLQEPMGIWAAAGCIISLCGAAVVSQPPFLFNSSSSSSSWSHSRLLGTLCGIASPMFGSGAGYCIRRIQKQEPALVVALWFHIVTISLLVWPLLAGWPEAGVMVGARDAALLLGISCSSFCAQLLMTRAFQLLPAARASALSFLGVVYAHAWGALVFGEQLTVFTLGGGLLIFAGVLLVTLSARATHKASAGSSSSSTAGKGVDGSNDSAGDVEAAVPLKAWQQQQQQLDSDSPDASGSRDQSTAVSAAQQAAATSPGPPGQQQQQQQQQQISAAPHNIITLPQHQHMVTPPQQAGLLAAAAAVPAGGQAVVVAHAAALQPDEGDEVLPPVMLDSLAAEGPVGSAEMRPLLHR